MLRIRAKLLIILALTCSCSSGRRSCVLPAGILNEVANLRGLKKKAEVPCIQTQSTEELKEILSETIDKRLPREQVELEGEILKLLGIIPKDYNYRERIISQYASRLSAFYSPEFKRFVLARNLGAEKKTILAHELTHALQDQHYDLNELTAVSVPSDTVMARTSIFEGDANLTMRRFSGEPFCQADTLEQVIKKLDYLKNERGEIPLFFEIQMAFPYLVGERFLCQAVQQSRKTIGGGLNEALAKTYLKLPHSTSQLLGFSDTIDLPSAECLKSDSYGVVGIASLLAAEINLERSISNLKTLIGDKLCLNRLSENKYKLYWRIKIKDDGDRVRLKDMLSDYFTKYIPKLSYAVSILGDEIQITISS